VKKILIIGSNGQLGTNLKQKLSKKFFVFNPKHRLDITLKKDLKKIINMNFDYLINCAAIHNLDYAENYYDKAFKVNSYASKNLAEICKLKKTVLIHISTDYVYDNRLKNKNTESKNLNPLNIYGTSKLVGEYFIRNTFKKYFIFRVASLFGTTPPSGKSANFIDTIYLKAKNGDDLRVVSDQKMSPTSTKLISNVIYKVIDKNIKNYGIYNLSCRDSCSWYNFAKKIIEFSGFKNKNQKLKYKDLKLKTERPLNSSLNINKIQKSFKINLPSWQKELKNYMKEKKYI